MIVLSFDRGQNFPPRLGACGGGLYLLSLHVDDVPATVARLRDAGVRLMGDPGPGNNIEGMVYVHPKGFSGVLALLYPHD